MLNPYSDMLLNPIIIPRHVIIDNMRDVTSSECGFLSMSSLTSNIDIINTIAPRIVNIRNIVLQEVISTMYPPIVGPIAGIIPIISPNNPITSGHFSSGITLNNTICVIGIIIPAPAASRTLPIMTNSMFGAKYIINDPIVNDVSDANSMLFSLNLLVIYADGGIITANTRRNIE